MFGRKNLTRREMLRWMGFSGGAILAARCAPTPAPEVPVATPTPVPSATPTPVPSATPITGPIRGGTLRFAVNESPSGFDPAILTGWADSLTSHWTRSYLVKVDNDFNVVPDAAESWEHEGAKTWVFHLRKGMLWHHGREFVADDVLYSIGRVQDPEVGSPGYPLFKDVKMGKEDDYTVAFELKLPNLDFISNLFEYSVALVPFDQSVEEHNTKPIGTGPWIFEEYVPGERVVFRRNENYFIEGLPYMDGVHMLFMPDWNVQLAALQAGTLDISGRLSFAQYEILLADPRVVPVTSPPVTQQVIYMDVTQPPFDDKRVRDAMRYIVDRQSLLDAAYFGKGQIGCDTPLVPGNRYRKDVGVCEQDIEKAKQLLAEAGYPDGLEIEITTVSERAAFMAVALAFQEQAKAANVKVTVRGVPGDIFWAKEWLSVPMGVSLWGARPSADAQIRLGYTCGASWNESKFCNEEMERLVDEAMVEADQARRQELYTRIQEIIATEGGTIIPFYYPLTLGAHRSNVVNYVPNFRSSDDVHQVWLTPEA